MKIDDVLYIDTTERKHPDIYSIACDRIQQ